MKLGLSTVLFSLMTFLNYPAVKVIGLGGLLVTSMVIIVTCGRVK